MKLRFAPFLALCAALGACSDIVPGLNISEGKSHDHAYRVVQSESDTGYQVVPADPEHAYDVTPITPALLRNIASTGIGALPAQQQPLKPLLPSEVPPEYRIGPGDVLFITVWDHPELTVAAGAQITDFNFGGRLVKADGTIFFPYAGTVEVQGKTVEDVRLEISRRIASVITKPQVDVRVTAFRSRRIEVTGEVLHPGTVTLDDTPKGILQAIGEAGGLTPNASRRRLVLVRAGSANLIDFSGLLSGVKPGLNVALEAGDSILVPDQSGDQVFVLGAVSKQEPIPMQQDALSLVQALAAAGGLDQLRAKDSGVLVFRQAQGNTRPVIFTLDMGDPQGMLLAGQFNLLPRDVVYVKATAFSQYNSVITQLLPTVQTIFEITDAQYLVKHQ